MRVLIGAFGTRGDVQPMLALAEALVAQRHSVSLGVSPSSLEQAREYVPDAYPVGMGYEELSRRASPGTMRAFLSLIPLLRGEVAVQLEALEPHAREADVIVGSSVCIAGSLLGELYDRRYVFTAYCPQIFPSGEHPGPALRGFGWPRWVNRLSWRMNEWVWRRLIGASLAEARATRGLPPLPEVWTAMIGHYPITACDPELAVVPFDQPRPIPQTGALFANERGELSPEVAEFLDRGSPPVYLGFGSMSDGAPRDTAARLLEAVRRAGVRALVARGWAGLEVDVSPPPEVLFIGTEPHGKLFPRCAAVVHHGGAGTTHAAARAGVPQVLMPHLLDQFYWAHKVERAGIGPRGLKRYTRDPEPLARAIRRCVEDGAMRERARLVSERIDLGGAQRAVKVLERLARLAPPEVSAHVNG